MMLSNFAPVSDYKCVRQSEGYSYYCYQHLARAKKVVISKKSIIECFSHLTVRKTVRAHRVHLHAQTFPKLSHLSQTVKTLVTWSTYSLTLKYFSAINIHCVYLQGGAWPPSGLGRYQGTHPTLARAAFRPHSNLLSSTVNNVHLTFSEMLSRAINELHWDHEK